MRRVNNRLGQLLYVGLSSLIIGFSCAKKDEPDPNLSTLGSLLGTEGLCVKSDDSGGYGYVWDSGWLDSGGADSGGYGWDSGFWNWDSGWSSDWDSGWWLDSGWGDTGMWSDTGMSSDTDDTSAPGDGTDSGGSTSSDGADSGDPSSDPAMWFQVEEDTDMERVPPVNQEAPGDPCSRRGEIDVRQGLSCSSVTAPASFLSILIMLAISIARRDDQADAS